VVGACVMGGGGWGRSNGYCPFSKSEGAAAGCSNTQWMRVETRCAGVQRGG